MQKKVTAQEVAQWVGSDASRDDILQILAEIANGEYLSQDLRSDVLDYINQ